jgi:hypothetical protein
MRSEENAQHHHRVLTSFAHLVVCHTRLQGKGGNSVRAVREESQAFVSIVKADFRHVQERIMILKGTVDQIATATKGIAILSVPHRQNIRAHPIRIIGRSAM